jgi:hypothetical protein
MNQFVPALDHLNDGLKKFYTMYAKVESYTETQIEITMKYGQQLLKYDYSLDMHNRFALCQAVNTLDDKLLKLRHIELYV